MATDVRGRVLEDLSMTTLREMIDGSSLVEAPVVFNPLSAKLAEEAGFRRFISVAAAWATFNV